jgi:Holliday junction resolvase RusA-like endonuclease
VSAARVWPLWARPIDPRFGLAFSVRIDGEPHGKGSVRVVQTAEGARGRQAPKSRKYESLLAELAEHQRPRPGFALPLDGPLIARVIAVKSRPQRVRKSLFLPYDPDEPEGRLYCPVVPDWDNVGKSAGDGLKKGKAIKDDARIVDGRVVTLWGREGESPFVETYIFAVWP